MTIMNMFAEKAMGVKYKDKNVKALEKVEMKTKIVGVEKSMNIDAYKLKRKGDGLDKVINMTGKKRNGGFTGTLLGKKKSNNNYNLKVNQSLGLKKTNSNLFKLKSNSSLPSLRGVANKNINVNQVLGISPRGKTTNPFRQNQSSTTFKGNMLNMKSPKAFNVSKFIGGKKKLNTNFFRKPKASAMSKINQHIGLSKFGDYDKDGVMNILDCQPRNRFKQGAENAILVNDSGVAEIPNQEVATMNTDVMEYEDRIEVPESEYDEPERTTITFDNVVDAEIVDDDETVIDVGEMAGTVKDAAFAGASKIWEYGIKANDYRKERNAKKEAKEAAEKKAEAEKIAQFRKDNAAEIKIETAKDNDFRRRVQLEKIRAEADLAHIKAKAEGKQKTKAEKLAEQLGGAYDAFSKGARGSGPAYAGHDPSFQAYKTKALIGGGTASGSKALFMAGATRQGMSLYDKSRMFAKKESQMSVYDKARMLGSSKGKVQPVTLAPVVTAQAETNEEKHLAQLREMELLQQLKEAEYQQALRLQQQAAASRPTGYNNVRTAQADPNVRIYSQASKRPVSYKRGPYKKNS